MKQRGALCSLCSDCSEMLVFGKNWVTRFTMVWKRSGMISCKMEQSLRHNIVEIDQLHQSNQRIPEIKSLDAGLCRDGSRAQLETASWKHRLVAKGNLERHERQWSHAVSFTF